MVNVHKDQERNIVKQLVNVQEILVNSTGECSKDTGKTCAKCPSNKPYYRQIPGGGECCDQKDVSNTYVNAKGLGSVSKKDKGNGNGSGSGSDTCESATYDYFITDYGKCAQGSGTKYCEATQLVNVQRILVKHVQNVHQINHITVNGECSRDIGKSCPKCPSN
eukprot:796727_1